jgi:hypothetical protein
MSDRQHNLAWGLCIFGIAVIAMGIFALSRSWYTDTLTTSSADWARTIYIDTYSAVQIQQERGFILPSDAYNVWNSSYYSQKTCYTTIYAGKTEFTTSYECGHTVYLVHYTQNKWVQTTPVTTSGDISVDRYWPDFTGSPTSLSPALGDRRESGREEFFTIHFLRSNNKIADYRCSNEQEWRDKDERHKWSVKVNRLEYIDWSTISYAG